MKKLVLALAAVTFSAGAALADNPYVGRDDVITNGPNAGEPIWSQDVDMAPTASIFPNSGTRDVGVEDSAQPANENFGVDAPSENVN